MWAPCTSIEPNKGLFMAIVMQILAVDFARKEPGWVPK